MLYNVFTAHLNMKGNTTKIIVVFVSVLVNANDNDDVIISFINHDDDADDDI
jgi:hypothetical protein